MLQAGTGGGGGRSVLAPSRRQGLWPAIRGQIGCLNRDLGKPGVLHTVRFAGSPLNNCQQKSAEGASRSANQVKKWDLGGGCATLGGMGDMLAGR